MLLTFISTFLCVLVEYVLSVHSDLVLRMPTWRRKRTLVMLLEKLRRTLGMYILPRLVTRFSNPNNDCFM